MDTNMKAPLCVQTLKNAVRLHALTGGMIAVAKDLDENMSYEENVRILLEPDSAFSTVLPVMLNEHFRTPESSKQSTYHLANTYFATWCRYVYGRQLMQTASPDALFQYVTDDINEHLTLPDFYSACLRYMQYAYKHYNNEYKWGGVRETKKAIPVKLRDGSTVIIDYCIKTDEFSYNLIFPHSLDMKYTKEEMDRIYEALDQINSRYYAHTVVFSFTRFSDWCVQEAARNEWFHIVPVEQLKY